MGTIAWALRIAARIMGGFIVLGGVLLAQTAPGAARTITLSELTTTTRLDLVTVVGVVLLCEGPSGTMGGQEICEDGDGNMVPPSDSIEFRLTDNGTKTLVTFCSDTTPGEVPDAGDTCPPPLTGDKAVEFESPALPGGDEETPYEPAVGEPGYAGPGIDYILISDTAPVPEPAMPWVLGGLLLLALRWRNSARGG